MSGKHVVIGGSGALGVAIVKHLTSQGESVRAMVRDVDRARRILPEQADIVAGDATSTESVRMACRDATVIYHCVSVPYDSWDTAMPRITENILVSAREAEARLVFPGNVHGYGHLRMIPATEDHALDSTNQKGRQRNAVERQMIDANLLKHVEVVIARFPDFYGPNVATSLMAPIFRSVVDGKKASWLGTLDAPHDLVYIDDAAEACCLLGANPKSYGQIWHVPGAGPLTGQEFVEMAFKSVGTKGKIGCMRGGLLGRLSPVVREMSDFMYLYEMPLVLDGAKFADAFPAFQYTPHDEAIRYTCAWYGQHPELER